MARSQQCQQVEEKRYPKTMAARLRELRQDLTADRRAPAFLQRCFRLPGRLRTLSGFFVEAANALRLVYNGDRFAREPLPVKATALGLVPAGKSILATRAIANPLAPPGLQGKADGEPQVSPQAKPGTLCQLILERRYRNLDGTTRYEYKGVAMDGFSHSSPLAFRTTPYFAEERFNRSGYLISSHIEYHEQGINITFLGANGKCLPIENVVDVTSQRTGTGYTTAIYTYDKSLFIADSLSDGQITNLQLQSRQRHKFSVIYNQVDWR